MAGRCPSSNSTSRTGPMIWTILPTFVPSATAVDMGAFVHSALGTRRSALDPNECRVPNAECPFLECLRARNDLDDFARDRRLANLVHIERQAFEHVRRVAGGGV